MSPGVLFFIADDNISGYNHRGLSSMSKKRCILDSCESHIRSQTSKVFVHCRDDGSEKALVDGYFEILSSVGLASVNIESTEDYWAYFSNG